MEKGKLNIFVIVAFVLIIVRHSVNILVQLKYLSMPETLEYNGMPIDICDHTAAVYNATLSVLIIIALAMVLNKKLLGAYMFLALQLANIIGLSAIEGENFDVTTSFIFAIVMAGIFSGLLCLRRDSKSGWSVLKGNKQTNNIDKEKK